MNCLMVFSTWSKSLLKSICFLLLFLFSVSLSSQEESLSEKEYEKQWRSYCASAGRHIMSMVFWQLWNNSLPLKTLRIWQQMPSRELHKVLYQSCVRDSIAKQENCSTHWSKQKIHWTESGGRTLRKLLRQVAWQMLKRLAFNFFWTSR